MNSGVGVVAADDDDQLFARLAGLLSVMIRPCRRDRSRWPAGRRPGGCATCAIGRAASLVRARRARAVVSTSAVLHSDPVF